MLIDPKTVMIGGDVAGTSVGKTAVLSGKRASGSILHAAHDETFLLFNPSSQTRFSGLVCDHG